MDESSVHECDFICLCSANTQFTLMVFDTKDASCLKYSTTAAHKKVQHSKLDVAKTSASWKTNADLDDLGSVLV